jgi:hypothetical protein
VSKRYLPVISLADDLIHPCARDGIGPSFHTATLTVSSNMFWISVAMHYTRNNATACVGGFFRLIWRLRVIRALSPFLMRILSQSFHYLPIKQEATLYTLLPHLPSLDRIQQVSLPSIMEQHSSPVSPLSTPTKTRPFTAHVPQDVPVGSSAPLTHLHL